MFVDFIGVCLDQIYNHMAKIHFESGGNVKVPMVLTMAVGGGYSDGAQHSQCLWGTFAHLPGMKVVVPSNPYDAKGLMIAAIRDDNPVVYMFHKGVMGLPWMAKNPRSIADVPEEAYEVPIGKARIARQGTRRHRRDDVAVGAPRPRRRRGSWPPSRASSVEVHRPAQPGAAGPGGHPRLGRQDRPAGRRRRGLPVLRAVRRGRRHGHRRRPGPAARRPSAGSRTPDVPVPYARSLEYAVLPRARPDRGGHPEGWSVPDGASCSPSLSQERPDAEGVVSHLVRDRRRAGGRAASCSPRCRWTRSPSRCPPRRPGECASWSPKSRRPAGHRDRHGGMIQASWPMSGSAFSLPAEHPAGW